jgi:hypothetical protein
MMAQARKGNYYVSKQNPDVKENLIDQSTKRKSALLNKKLCIWVQIISTRVILCLAKNCLHEFCK